MTWPRKNPDQEDLAVRFVSEVHSEVGDQNQLSVAIHISEYANASVSYFKVRLEFSVKNASVIYFTWAFLTDSVVRQKKEVEQYITVGTVRMFIEPSAKH